jgi:PAS domain S-box-containing protein
MRDESRAHAECADNVRVSARTLLDMNASSIDIDTPDQWARMLQTLLSHLDGMVYRCRDDERWTMEFVSQGCLKLTGYQSSELLFNCRSSYQEIVHPEDRTRVDHVIRTALAARKNYVIEYRIVRADGEVRWVAERGVGVYVSMPIEF